MVSCTRENLGRLVCHIRSTRTHSVLRRFGVYFWPGLIIWCFDRFLRFSRIIYFNRVWLGLRYARASVELLSSDTVRLTFRRKMSWKPGQHIYLNMPGISRFPGELHPFTIASIPTTHGGEGSKVVCIIKVRRNSLTMRIFFTINPGKRWPD